MSADAKTPGALVRAVDFEGHKVVTVLWEGRPAWIVSQVGEALGYPNGGQRFADKIRGEWAEEFIEGVDFEVLTNGRLAGFREVAPTDSVGAMVRHLLVVRESGLHLLLLKTRKPAGRRLRRMLATEVLPQLMRTGQYAPPTPPSPPPVLPPPSLPASPPPAPPDLRALRCKVVGELAPHIVPLLAAGDLDGAQEVARMLRAVLMLPVAKSPTAARPAARTRALTPPGGAASSERRERRPRATASADDPVALPPFEVVRALNTALGEVLRAGGCSMQQFNELRAALGVAPNLADLLPHLPTLVALARELTQNGHPVTAATLTAALAVERATTTTAG